MLGIAVAIVAIVALQHPNGGHASGSTASSRSAGTQHTSSAGASGSRSAATGHSSASSPQRPAGSTGNSSTGVTAERLPLVVLNNTTTTGLAAQAAKRFEAGGWTVTSSGNLQNDILSTCAYYDPSVAGAKAAAQALQQQFSTIKRVEPKFAQLPAGPVVVVLTPDYSPN